MAFIDGLEVLAASAGCSGKSCPTIYRKDEDTLIVQGYSSDNLFSTDLPDGESAVAIPIALLRDLKF